MLNESVNTNHCFVHFCVPTTRGRKAGVVQPLTDDLLTGRAYVIPTRKHHKIRKTLLALWEASRTKTVSCPQRDRLLAMVKRRCSVLILEKRLLGRKLPSMALVTLAVVPPVKSVSATRGGAAGPPALICTLPAARVGIHDISSSRWLERLASSHKRAEWK